MKRWIKLEALPLLLLLSAHAYIFAQTDLEAWQSVAAFLVFLVASAATGIFYGHAVAMSSGGGFDFIGHLKRQKTFSLATFGPGPRTQMVVDHIRKELVEVELNPADLDEWVDVILLGLDGAWRAGHRPGAIAAAIAAKQARNEQRQWPDWRQCNPNKAIQHIRASSEVVDTSKGGA